VLLGTQLPCNTLRTMPITASLAAMPRVIQPSMATAAAISTRITKRVSWSEQVSNLDVFVFDSMIRPFVVLRSSSFIFLMSAQLAKQSVDSPFSANSLA